MSMYFRPTPATTSCLREIPSVKSLSKVMFTSNEFGTVSRPGVNFSSGFRPIVLFIVEVVIWNLGNLGFAFEFEFVNGIGIHLSSSSKVILTRVAPSG